MLLINNLPLEQSEINPLPIEEVKKFQENVNPHFLPFFTVAFFTGMRSGKMAALNLNQQPHEVGDEKVSQSFPSNKKKELTENG